VACGGHGPGGRGRDFPHPSVGPLVIPIIAVAVVTGCILILLGLSNHLGTGVFKMDRKITIAVSGTLVGCMFANAAEGLAQGKALSEIHTITSAPLVIASSVSSSAAAVDYVHHNTIYDTVHIASVPQESELRLGGLTITLP
jgi:hypothetical protein